jgi:hypothetical protein
MNARLATNKLLRAREPGNGQAKAGPSRTRPISAQRGRGAGKWRWCGKPAALAPRRSPRPAALLPRQAGPPPTTAAASQPQVLSLPNSRCPSPGSGLQPIAGRGCRMLPRWRWGRPPWRLHVILPVRCWATNSPEVQGPPRGNRPRSPPEENKPACRAFPPTPC